MTTMEGPRGLIGPALTARPERSMLPFHAAFPSAALKLQNSYKWLAIALLRWKCRLFSEIPVSTEKYLDITNRQRMNWPTTIVLVFFHAGAVAALFMANWRAVAVAIFLYWMATGLGISM